MLVANKTVTLQGKTYAAGERVDGSTLAPGKAEQLLAQRVLRDADVTAPKSCVLLRDARINGRNFKRGTKVNTSRLDPAKVSQLLDHRILGPATAP